MVRVLLVDDHALVRAGLRLLLDEADGIETVGEAGNAADAVRLARELEPDIVLLDIVMPGQTGIEVLPELRRVAPESRIVMLSMEDDPNYLRTAFDRGAVGYVLKEAADEELIGALRDVAAGNEYVHPVLGARVAKADIAERRRQEEDPLSVREREILRLLALGHTNKEIAGMLYLSVRTVESHRAHIFQKLRIDTRTELVRYALDQGMLDD
ncbi:MAG: response regulator [Gaiellales bacterium]